MPKIMYRPNPVPPPFVPPVPSYDDTLYVKVNPFNFEDGEGVTINILPGNFPPFSIFEIGYGSVKFDFADYAISGQFTSEQFGQNIEQDALVDNSNQLYFTAKFTLLDEQYFYCNVVFQEL